MAAAETQTTEAAPEVTVGDDQSVHVNAGLVTVPGHSPSDPGGGVDEDGQGLTLTVTNDNNGLFTVQPDIDPATGDLTYTVSGTTGTATVTVVPMDNGGTANGGVDTGAAETFDITVTPLPRPVRTVSIDDVTVEEGDDGTTPATFTLTLSRPSPLDHTITLSVSDGTAESGSDFTAPTTAMIPAGETSAPYVVQVIGDEDVEEDETFTVTITDGGGVLLGDRDGLGTITNDDQGLETAQDADNSDRSVLSSQITVPNGLTTRQVGVEVLLANEDTFADSLASAVLQQRRPLLLTDASELESEVDEELVRLGATHVRILGGQEAIPQAIEDELVAQGYVVTRTAGETRLETAAAIAALVPESTTAILARAYAAEDGDPTQAFIDAIAAGAWSTQERWPVLLTESDVLSTATAEHLAASAITRVLVVGGQAAIHDTVIEQLLAMGLDVERVAGPSRFDTAVEVAGERGFPTDRQPGSVVLVDGFDPDGWAAGFTLAAYAAINDSAIVLSINLDVPPVTTTFLESLSPTDDMEGRSLLCAALVQACDVAADVLSR